MGSLSGSTGPGSKGSALPSSSAVAACRQTSSHRSVRAGGCVSTAKACPSRQPMPGLGGNRSGSVSRSTGLGSRGPKVFFVGTGGADGAGASCAAPSSASQTERHRASYLGAIASSLVASSQRLIQGNFANVQGDSTGGGLQLMHNGLDIRKASA